MTENICKVLSFAEAREFLSDVQFFRGEIIDADIIYGGIIYEKHIFSLAEKFNKKITWHPIPNWYKFEIGEIDIEPEPLLHISFAGLNYDDETLLIITDESYHSKRVFVVDYPNYVEFAENYDQYLGYNMDFTQPMDYIFFLIKQKTVVMIHHEGLFCQIKFG